MQQRGDTIKKWFGSFNTIQYSIYVNDYRTLEDVRDEPLDDDVWLSDSCPQWNCDAKHLLHTWRQDAVPHPISGLSYMLTITPSATVRNSEVSNWDVHRLFMSFLYYILQL